MSAKRYDVIFYPPTGEAFYLAEEATPEEVRAVVRRRRKLAARMMLDVERSGPRSWSVTGPDGAEPTGFEGELVASLVVRQQK